MIVVSGSLPKGYTGGGKKRLWKYELAITALGVFIGLGILLGLLVDPEYNEKHAGNFFLIWFYASFPAIAVMIFVVRKYRTLEQEKPSGWTKLYYRDRAQKQCKLCQKHPVSKKYHINNEHNLKDVNVNEYFQDCGCDICAHYDQSGG